jgi:glycosyltransferase involved in cell wall biosynthesis
MLAWGRGAETAALQKFARSQKRPSLISVAQERLGRRVEFEELLPAADVVVVPSEKPVATLPISICMAAALPIVATVSYTTGELLEDRHTALLAQPRSPRALARRILDVDEDRSLQWSISDMARTEAYEYFTLTRFLNQYRQAYRQISAGQKVELPGEAPGAGMRFHGRG